MAAEASTEITELAVDDHACLTFGEEEELFDLTAAFVRDGLAAGLQVMWLSDAGPHQAAGELARRGIAMEAAGRGQMIAGECEGRLLSGQVFRADAAVGWLARQMTSAREAGFPGLRVAVDMGWALRPVTGIEELPRFEEGITGVLGDGTASVLCQYDRGRFDPVTLASVAEFHTRSVAAATYHADAVLRICRQYAPPGIRIAGEIDYQAAEPLALALSEAVRLDGDIVINLAGLAFADAACTAMIADAVRAMSASRQVLLRCQPGVATGFARLGVGGLARVKLVTADDR
ncbi:MAG: MEDS domain-containing protein [Actinobacteria bacterium]|nr:MEDS domain-containing protein [Actinomycetota bacterium]MBO0814462.1 MEDS domain-containing protein [Actinomycetota bacterium]